MAGEHTEVEALVEIVNIGKTAVVSGKPAIDDGYVWPNDWSVYPDVPKLPFLYVSMLPVVENEWYRKVFGKGEQRWTAEILFPVAMGTFDKMNDASAAASLATQGWAKALSDVFWTKQTLNGTATGIGIGGGGPEAVLFTFQEGHVPIGETWFWGLRIEMFVRQIYAQPMGA